MVPKELVVTQLLRTDALTVVVVGMPKGVENTP